MKTKIVRISLKLFNTNDEFKFEKLSKTFVSYLTEYCTSENNLLDALRLLRQIRYAVRVNKEQSPRLADRYNYLLHIIETEIEINKLKIKQPDLRIRIPKLLKWTDTLTALVELIYGIENISVNFGKG